MKHILEENVESSPLPENKKIKQLEALQELIQIHPDLKGKSVYFFYKSNKFVEGILIYDRSENMSYVYDPKSGNKFNSFFQWLNVLKKQGLRLIFFGSEGNVEKDMTIVWNGNLISYEVNVLGKVVKDIDLIRPGVAAERTFTDVEEAIEYVFDAKICNGKSTKGKPNEIYHQVDCHLLVDLKGTCENCKKLKNTLIKICRRYLNGTKSVKTNHASQEILSEAVQEQRKVVFL
nr:16006_t:CDS:2 [Entrophospora candida]